VPQTSTDLMKALCRRWGGEFAKRPAMPPMSGEPWPGVGPARRRTRAERCDRVRVELGAWTSSKSHRAVSGSGRSCSSSRRS
jgi:hypothetical protein